MKNPLRRLCSTSEYRKLEVLDNERVIRFLEDYAGLCSPASIFVRTDSSADAEYLREKAKSLGEEKALATKGHTVHFDGYFDQARDKKNTKYLFAQDRVYSNYINGVNKQDGLSEVKGYLKDIMAGKEMFVCFFCLCPAGSPFSILAVQITDSAYVAHSEDILYRPGYELLKEKKNDDFFRFIHSAGNLENNVSKDTSKRRVYIDLEENTVYSVNTQYAGNTVGLKKLSLRLAINKGSKEGWLAEHMFILGINNDKGEKAYLCGAYPSMCGKTSTSMVKGVSIIGDDIAYLRARDDKIYATNVERGIFGIIKDVNSKDDPVLYKTLDSEGEIIFSNILIDEKGYPYWYGKGVPLPHKGVNFSGDWFPGKTDSEGEEIPASHKNARYTLRLSSLENVDDDLENPDGVEVKGIIYGGRDSDTSVPVEESFNWRHGIITKAASLESETTAATLGQEGVRVFNPMSNMDFISIPLGEYIKNNLDFGDKVSKPPRIFSVNYFLKDKQHNKFLADMEDKRIWLQWMRLRIDNSAGALSLPTGYIPLYDDLKYLFKKMLNKDYSKEYYISHFTLRAEGNISKIERIRNIYSKIENIPSALYDELSRQEERLIKAREKWGDYVSPYEFAE